MKIILPEAVKNIIKRFEDNGFEAYAVGGCVRDSLMGKTPEDWDITTNAHTDEIKEIFSDCNVIETGIKHGTVTVVICGVPYEITTYRVDGGYSDRRRPDEVFFTSDLEEDLKRRDFTVNAMAYNGSRLVDCFGGAEDLKSGIIRCVGEADRRFEEDALRILRALRFSSVLGFVLEEKTAVSLLKNYPLLKNVSAERIFCELQKLLCGDDVYRVLTEYSEVFAFIIPETAPCIGFDQNNPHHNLSLWEHIAAVVSNVPPEPVLRFAALFHDLGKPPTESRDKSGISHFIGHGDKSADISAEILKRLKCSNSFSKAVTELVLLHDRFLDSAKTQKKLMSAYYPEIVQRLLYIRAADIAAQSDFKREEKQEKLEAAKRIYSEILACNACLSLKDLKINGNDLINMGIRGKEIGRVLNGLLDSVLSDETENEREVLLKKAALLKGSDR